MKKFYLFLLLSVMIIGLSACSNNNSKNSGINPINNNSNNSQNINSTGTASQLGTTTTNIVRAVALVDPSLLTLSEISKHNTSTDCWMAVSGKVYNVTLFIKSGLHPGGDKILNGCGKDATLIYQSVGKHNSPTAQSTLTAYLLGNLKK